MSNNPQAYEAGSLFNCLACFGKQDEPEIEKGKEVVFLDQYRNSQPKPSLKIPIAANAKLVARQSEKAFTKAGVNRCSLRKKSGQFNTQTDLFLHEKGENLQNANIPTNTSIPVPSSHQRVSSRIVESQTLIQPALPKEKVSKIKFIYNDRPTQPNKRSQIHFEGQFDPLPEIDFTNKISEINKRSLPSQPMRESDIPDPTSIHSSVSPINILYRATNKDIVISKDLGQRSDNNSFQGSRRIKRLPSYNESFGRGKIKVRQTESIREPEDESSVVYSVVISNSFIVKPGGLLVPIYENEFQTKLSQFKE